MTTTTISLSDLEAEQARLEDLYRKGSADTAAEYQALLAAPQGSVTKAIAAARHRDAEIYEKEIAAQVATHGTLLAAETRKHEAETRAQQRHAATQAVTDLRTRATIAEGLFQKAFEALARVGEKDAQVRTSLAAFENRSALPWNHEINQRGYGAALVRWLCDQARAAGYQFEPGHGGMSPLSVASELEKHIP